MFPERVRFVIVIVGCFAAPAGPQPERAGAAAPPVDLAQVDLDGGDKPLQAVGDTGGEQPGPVAAARLAQGFRGSYNACQIHADPLGRKRTT
jgi:hypothetical protein